MRLNHEPGCCFRRCKSVLIRAYHRVNLGVREGLGGEMENVVLSIGASVVMLYLIIALIRPEWF
jgi:hypothetical protein